MSRRIGTRWCSGNGCSAAALVVAAAIIVAAAWRHTRSWPMAAWQRELLEPSAHHRLDAAAKLPDAIVVLGHAVNHYTAGATVLRVSVLVLCARPRGCCAWSGSSVFTHAVLLLSRSLRVHVGRQSLPTSRSAVCAPRRQSCARCSIAAARTQQRHRGRGRCSSCQGVSRCPTRRGRCRQRRR
jgi:hypothetical protein